MCDWSMQYIQVYIVCEYAVYVFLGGGEGVEEGGGGLR